MRSLVFFSLLLFVSAAGAYYISNYYGVHISQEFVKIGVHYATSDWEAIRVVTVIGEQPDILNMTSVEWGALLSMTRKRAKSVVDELCHEEMRDSSPGGTLAAREHLLQQCFTEQGRHKLQQNLEAVVVVPDQLPGGAIEIRMKIYPHHEVFKLGRWIPKAIAITKGFGLRQDNSEIYVLILENNTFGAEVSIIGADDGVFELLSTAKGEPGTALLQMLQMYNEALAECEISEVHSVVAVGNFNVSVAKRVLYEHFGNVLFDLDDQVVAQGAALMGADISGYDACHNILIDEWIELSIGVETTDGRMAVVLPQGSPVPCKRSQVFAVGKQNAPVLRVYEGEHVLVASNVLLATMDLTKITSGMVAPQIEITMEMVPPPPNFCLDRSSLRITATCKGMSIQATVTGQEWERRWEQRAGGMDVKQFIERHILDDGVQ